MKTFTQVVQRVVGTALVLGCAAAYGDSLDSGDSAWILTSTALVLFMTIPGLSLFYGGLVRSNSVLSVLMQCFAITCLVTILWLVIGYSLAFGEGNNLIGGLGKILFNGVGEDALHGTIPESLFAVFQLTFAIITPALIVGGLRRTDAFLRRAVVHDLLVAPRLRTDRALGVGRRLAQQRWLVR